MIEREVSSISVIVPLYREGRTGIEVARSLLGESGWREIVLAVAGERPSTLSELERLAGDSGGRLRRVLCPDPGRATQMNRGAAEASGDVLLFLHADTLLPEGAPLLISEALRSGRDWGRFQVQLAADGWIYRLVEGAMNLRSRLSGIATGDQAIFMRSERFLAVGGYPPIALMEDIEISRRLKQSGWPSVIGHPAVTSARRWQQHGALRTILLMWRLRFLYWLGTDPAKLAQRYQDAR